MVYNADMKKIKKVLKKCCITVMASAMCMSQAGTVLASDASDRQALEAYLEELKLQIEENNASLDDIYLKIEDVNNRISDNNAVLEEQTESLETQKSEMSKRIQYMYEAGSSMVLLAAVLSSESWADVLNKASYINELVGYDREMLQQYIDTVQTIQDTQTALEEEKNELYELKNNFEQTKQDAKDALSDVTARLAEYGVEETDAYEVLRDYMQDIKEDIPEEMTTGLEQIEETAGSTETEEESTTSAKKEQTAETSTAKSDKTAETTTNKNDSEKESTTKKSETTTEKVTTKASETTTEKATTKAPETTTEKATTTKAPETTTEPETTTVYVEPETEYVEPETSYSSDVYVPIDTYGYSTQDIYDLARVTYLEDGCVGGTYMSVYLCACVILNRANNWYGGSISAAIYDGGQYATAYKYDNWGGGELTINDTTWAAVSDALANTDPNPYYQCNGDWLADMGLTEYYRDEYTDEVFYYNY